MLGLTPKKALENIRTKQIFSYKITGLVAEPHMANSQRYTILVIYFILFSKSSHKTLFYSPKNKSDCH